MTDNTHFIRCTLVSVVALLLAFGPGAPVAAQTNPETLATIDGKSITRAEVEASTSAQLRSLQTEYERNRFQLVEDALNKLIEERLLAAEKTTREQLLSTMKIDVTAEEADAFYEENKAEIPKPKEEVRLQIQQYLQQKKQLESWQSAMDALRKKYGVRVVMGPLRTEVAAVGTVRGNANAPVTLIEFSDFQCQFCRRFSETLDEVMAKYGDKVRLVLRHFPLEMHAEAQKAAEASLCAGDQGKFWQMHDALFANQRELGVGHLKARAKELKLDAKAFDQCLDSGKHAEAVRADWKAGIEAGVSGTPALFVNGRYISGSVPLEQLSVVIDDELQRKAKP